MLSCKKQESQQSLSSSKLLFYNWNIHFYDSLLSCLHKSLKQNRMKSSDRAWLFWEIVLKHKKLVPNHVTLITISSRISDVHKKHKSLCSSFLSSNFVAENTSWLANVLGYVKQEGWKNFANKV